MIAVCMILMKSSTVKPFLVHCGLSDLARNLKMWEEFSRPKRLKRSFGETRNSKVSQDAKFTLQDALYDITGNYLILGGVNVPSSRESGLKRVKSKNALGTEKWIFIFVFNFFCIFTKQVL